MAVHNTEHRLAVSSISGLNERFCTSSLPAAGRKAGLCCEIPIRSSPRSVARPGPVRTGLHKPSENNEDVSVKWFMGCFRAWSSQDTWNGDDVRSALRPYAAPPLSIFLLPAPTTATSVAASPTLLQALTLDTQQVELHREYPQGSLPLGHACPSPSSFPHLLPSKQTPMDTRLMSWDFLPSTRWILYFWRWRTAEGERPGNDRWLIHSLIRKWSRRATSLCTHVGRKKRAAQRSASSRSYSLSYPLPHSLLARRISQTKLPLHPGNTLSMLFFIAPLAPPGPAVCWSEGWKLSTREEWKVIIIVVWRYFFSEAAYLAWGVPKGLVKRETQELPCPCCYINSIPL